jgi:hypothetical protein
MTTFLIIVAIGGFLAWINSASSSESSHSSMFDDSDTDNGTSLFHDQDNSIFHNSCSWCGSSLCSGGIGCMNSSNPLSGFHEDIFHHDTNSIFHDTDMFHHDHSSFDDSFSSISSHSSFDE